MSHFFLKYLTGNGAYLPEESTIGYLRKAIDECKGVFLTTVNLPGHLRSWQLKIILEPGVTIKVKLSNSTNSQSI